MEPFIRKNVTADLYIGTNAGKELFQSIRRAEHSVKVVSPYLGKAMVALLKEKAAAGLDVLLVSCDMNQTSSNTSGHDHLLGMLLNQHCLRDPAADRTRRTSGMLVWLLWIAAVLLSLVIVYFAAAARDPSRLAALFLPVVLVFGGKALRIKIDSIPLYRYEYTPAFPFKIIRATKKFNLHSKIYVIDDHTAYIGSLNFTANGFYHFFESCAAIKTAPDVLALSRYIDTFFDTYPDFYTDDELGALYFDEPAT